MRGRIPVHDIQRCRKVLLDSLLVKRRKQLLRRNMCGNNNNTLIKRSSIIIPLIQFCSNSCIIIITRMIKTAKSDVFNQISTNDFYHVCGFWPEQFKEIS